MMELTENLRIAQEQGFGPTDGDIARFTAYQTKVAELETKWAELKRTFQEGLVIEVSFVGTAAKWLWDHMPGETVQGDQASIDRMNADEQLAERNSARQCRAVRKLPPSESHRRAGAEADRSSAGPAAGGCLRPAAGGSGLSQRGGPAQARRSFRGR